MTKFPYNYTGQRLLANIKYCKFILGVHKSSSNQAVLGKLGRFPLFIDIIINLFKYYKRINDMEQEIKTLHQPGKISWYSNLTNVLNCFNIDKDISELSNLKSELEKQYEQFWKINIKKSSKLGTYSSLKSSFCAESYLFTIKNENKRKSLARLRISAHTLEIERGRFNKLKREEWLCKTCLKIEDEPHFLLDCNLFKINNDKIRLFMERDVPNFNFMDIKQQFVFLMINEDIKYYIFYKRYRI